LERRSRKSVAFKEGERGGNNLLEITDNWNIIKRHEGINNYEQLLEVCFSCTTSRECILSAIVGSFPVTRTVAGQDQESRHDRSGRSLNGWEGDLTARKSARGT
jgi:hypothetical protein